MELKVCTQCKEEKHVSLFSKNPNRKSGFLPKCKECRRFNNKIYCDNNKELIKERNKVSRDKLKNPEKYSKKIIFSDEEKKKKVSDYTTKYISERRKSDPLFRLKINLRCRISSSFVGISKKSKTIDILGMDYEKFRFYIESLFKEGMTWDNYGEWHLDHITPISWANSEEEIYKLNHYSNFQPLWSIDNLSKGNRYSK